MRKNSLGVRLLHACALVLLCMASGVASAARTVQWTITDLGALGTTGAVATAINNRGEVVGYSTKRIAGQPGEPFHGFLWQNGAMQDVGVPTGSFSRAMGINDRGTIVVTASGDALYLWKDGQWSSLGFAGFASDINKSETVVGGASNGSAHHAFLWRDGMLSDLGTLGGTFSSAVAVNDKGVTVGMSDVTADGSVMHPFVCDNGVMRDLGTLGGRLGIATDVNNHGDIVGWAENASRVPTAFIADVSGGMRPLFENGINGYARSINDHGAIVGGYGDFNSFLYDGGTLTILEQIPAVRAAGWTRLFPVAINDRGWIVGTGFSPAGQRAFVLVPN